MLFLWETHFTFEVTNFPEYFRKYSQDSTSLKSREIESSTHNTDKRAREMVRK